VTDGIPIPTRLLEPWIEDNRLFIGNDMAERRKMIERLDGHRQRLLDEGEIEAAPSVPPIPLAAVDAAVLDASVGDMVSTLVQVVWIGDDGATRLPPPVRFTGIDGLEMSLARTPVRVAAECAELAASEGVTIADTSFWSLLMEVNQAITRVENVSPDKGSSRALKDAVTRLTEGRLFLDTLGNPNVIAMSKQNQSCKIGREHVSDREAYGQILRAGEYRRPQGLTESTKGHFGVEKRRFTAADRETIKTHYSKRVGVTFYKPHAWSRAFRIEAHLDRMLDRAWLAGVLAGIAAHTTSRTGREPFPQYMADWTAKRLSAVAKLYGDLNFHRAPWLDPARHVGERRGGRPS
jgi:hypothetical protein